MCCRFSPSWLICCAKQCYAAHAWPKAACWIKTPIRPPSANTCIILAVSTTQHYTSLSDQKDLSEHWLVCAPVSPSAPPHPHPHPLSWLYCLALPSIVNPLSPRCIHQDANLHPRIKWAFHSYIITCIRLIVRDGGSRRGTREPTWLTLTFQPAEGKADGWWM